MTQNIHVSVAWPYANGDLHVGHLAGNFLPADIFARYHRLKGNNVLMVSGSDSHGTPVILKSQAEGVTPRETFEHYHHRFLEVQKQVGITYDLYTHTDTENHHKVAQDIFLKLLENEAIYQETQQMLYDTEADRFVPDRFVEGTCYHCDSPGARGDQCDTCGRLIDAVQLIDPKSKFTGSTPEIRETVHYFLDLGQFKEELHVYLADKDFWRPQVINFARNMVDELRGRPITRDVDWGVDVPLDGWDDKKLYVWFEAVMGYFTASIEWANNTGQPDAWKDWWYDPDARIFNFLGKDNIPFHTVMWQSELLGIAGIYDDDGRPLNLPYNVPANEYMTVAGSQFSKSRNWAIWLPDILERYDVDTVRYYVAANMPEVRDTDFTWEDFVTRNNSELVGWWGNLVNRVLKFGYKNWDGVVPEPGELRDIDRALLAKIEAGYDHVGDLLEQVKLRRALDDAMALVRDVNGYLDEAPWFGVIKEDKQAAATTVYTAMQAINHLKVILSPWLPNSSQQLHEMLGFEGQLFGTLDIIEYEESTRSHEALVYDGSQAMGEWKPQPLEPGQALQKPEALFKKLDAEKTVADEIERMEASVQ